VEEGARKGRFNCLFTSSPLSLSHSPSNRKNQTAKKKKKNSSSPTLAARASSSNDNDDQFAHHSHPLSADDLGDWRAFRAALVTSERGAGPPPTVGALSEPARAAARWAHAVSAPEKGCLLLAARPDLGPLFTQAVVLIVDHGKKRGGVFFHLKKKQREKEVDFFFFSLDLLFDRKKRKKNKKISFSKTDDAAGSAGLVLNAPSRGLIGDVGLDHALAGSFSAQPLYCGGPVAQNSLHLLHGERDRSFEPEFSGFSTKREGKKNAKNSPLLYFFIPFLSSPHSQAPRASKGPTRSSAGSTLAASLRQTPWSLPAAPARGPSACFPGMRVGSPGSSRPRPRGGRGTWWPLRPRWCWTRCRVSKGEREGERWKREERKSFFLFFRARVFLFLFFLRLPDLRSLPFFLPLTPLFLLYLIKYHQTTSGRLRDAHGSREKVGTWASIMALAGIELESGLGSFDSSSSPPQGGSSGDKKRRGRAQGPPAFD